MNARVCVALITVPNESAAKAMARGLVEARLAACVNVVSTLTSFYIWEGRLNEDNEALLIAKTRPALLPKLIGFVHSRHPAQTPEIIALPVAAGDKPYLDWVSASTGKR